MKAIRFNSYGPPDVLQLAEVEKPTPNDQQMLVKVSAASANPLDWHLMEGKPFIARLDGGLLKPKDPKLGADVAGIVEAVGKDVTEFKPGGAVFGAIGSGGFAEYALGREKHFALKPAKLSYEQAASVGVVGLTAIQGFRYAGGVKPGQKILVNGAAGGLRAVVNF
jgi:NADPH:quinone reductase-like Zn-dependent oxidoreductase